MPNMVSLRKFRLATTTGHMIQFESKVPTYVPDEALSDAMAAGCVPEDPDMEPFLDDKNRKRVDFTGKLRQSILHLAIDEMVNENNAKNFDGSGLPKTEALSKVLGFEVFKDERRKATQTLLSARKSKEDVDVHPDAQKVMDIIQAEGKSDLVALAAQAGVDAAHANALTTKDLRAHLLGRYSGLTA